jgi:hypothetical protein
VRAGLAVLCILGLALAGAAGAAPSFKATLTASTHTPKVNSNWFYVLSVTDAKGKLVKASVTAQLVDPFGGVHAVEFGCCKATLAKHSFTGVFGDYVKFPPEAQGVKLVFRLTVTALGARRVVTYWIKPR